MALTIPKLTDKITANFTWKDALWLPSWNRAATEEDGLTQKHLDNIKATAMWMQEVRDFFGKPIIVHCWLRPIKYNKQIGGSKNSSHLYGYGVDFHVKGIDCATAKKMILDAGLLDKKKLRMEDIKGEWIHLDDRAVGASGKRYFKP